MRYGYKEYNMNTQTAIILIYLSIIVYGISERLSIINTNQEVIIKLLKDK